jgi:glycerol kinase
LKKKYILAIDQGTSATKSLVFDEEGKVVTKGSQPLHTNYYRNGFVEQDPEDIYQNVLSSVKNCMDRFNAEGFSTDSITAIGISNQRETFVIWDKDGKPLHPAIVWQCKRSIQICEELKKKDLSTTVRQKTGLVIDPYFSATKLIWLFRNLDSIQQAVSSGNAFFGTIDTWLLYKLTKGKEYATDYTNASRTLFFNLHTLEWDNELIELFGLTGIRLPQIKSSSAHYGDTDIDGLLGKVVPVAALIGDSHAAAFGEGCFEAGDAKATMGTGCSILMNVGDKVVDSEGGMVTTICWSTQGRIDYALEGVIVSCGATIEWLKNELKLFTNSAETEAMAKEVADNGGVYLIPAFSGLGSPHWQMNRRASIEGLSLGTTSKHIVRAALESIPYQVKDIIGAMEKEAGIILKELVTDGGITSNQFVMQFMADLLAKNVSSIQTADVSALGAAYLAGLQAGYYESIESLKKLNADKKKFAPIPKNESAQYYEGWLQYIREFTA